MGSKGSRLAKVTLLCLSSFLGVHWARSGEEESGPGTVTWSHCHSNTVTLSLWCLTWSGQSRQGGGHEWGVVGRDCQRGQGRQHLDQSHYWQGPHSRGPQICLKILLIPPPPTTTTTFQLWSSHSLDKVRTMSRDWRVGRYNNSTAQIHRVCLSE